MIPWLVQHATEGETVGMQWDTVLADTSAKAAATWVSNIGLTKYPLPMRVRVAPAARILHHSTGVPMMCREFVIEEAKQC